MLKPLLFLSAVLLYELAPSPTPLLWLQEPTQATPPAAAAPPATTGTNPVKPTSESQARAKKIYGYDCLMCHGANGDGKTDLAKDMQLTVSDLSDPKTLAGKTDGEIFDVIKNGKGKMPAETGRAKTDELWSLVTYVRNLPKEHAAPSIKVAQIKAVQ
jgi:mono/diheme cytochrome c family protein